MRIQKVIDFNKVTTKHVRLVYLEAANNNGAAAELKLHQPTFRQILKV